MFAIKALTVAFLAVLPLASGSPTLRPRQYDPAIWTAEPWNGDFVYYKTASVYPKDPTTVPANVTERSEAVQKRANDCGGSSFNPNPVGSPYGRTDDCWGLRDYLLAHDVNYGVESGTSGVYEVLFHGTCAFAAGTQYVFLTLIGNEDMADILRDSINTYQYNGNIGAHGNMKGCKGYFATASTNWAIGQTGLYWQDASNGGV